MFKPAFEIPSIIWSSKYPVSVLGLKIHRFRIPRFRIPRFRKVVQHLCSRNPVSGNGSEVDVQNTQFQETGPKSMFKILSFRKCIRSPCSRYPVSANVLQLDVQDTQFQKIKTQFQKNRNTQFQVQNVRDTQFQV